MNFYRRKLLNAVLYFVKSRGRKQTSMTMLAKLLFYFDFEHFKETGYPAIGLEYNAFPWGPLPLNFWSEVKDGAVPSDFKGKLRINEVRDDINSKKRTVEFHALSAPDMNVFSPRETRVLERVAFMFKDAEVRDIVAASHEKGTPWAKTVKERGERASIDYLSSLDQSSPLTPDDAKVTLDEFFAVMKNFQLNPTN